MIRIDEERIVEGVSQRDVKIEKEIARTIEDLRQKYIDVVPDKEYWRVATGLAYSLLRCAFYGGERSAKMLSDLITIIRYFETEIVPRPPLASYQVSQVVEMLDKGGELLKDEEISLIEFIEMVLRLANHLLPELFNKTPDYRALTEEIVDFLLDENNRETLLGLLAKSQHYTYRRK